MSKKILIFCFIVFFAIFLGIFLFNKENLQSNSSNLAKLILFYSVKCSHCAKVEEFIKENKIKEKIAFEEKEVYFNKENARQLGEIAKKCGFNENEIGVPFLWDGEKQKCIVGDEPIINFFKEKLNL
jgi:glutaredoxin